MLIANTSQISFGLRRSSYGSYTDRINFPIFIGFSTVTVLWTRNVKSFPVIVHSNINYACVNVIFNFVPELFLTWANKIFQTIYWRQLRTTTYDSNYYYWFFSFLLNL